MLEQRIAEQGLRVVELFTACGSAPDDLDVARAADEALARLEVLLTEAEDETGTGTGAQADAGTDADGS
ncbi:hypothetical protein ACFFR6_34875 [Saccharothrix mutabilis subsp. capreolus]|nr:hypothetical protein GCM10017745_66780 [Saccharothrix mutabilis subsp. capreolus]